MVKPLLPDPELLRRLVAFDTTSHHSNLPLAEFLRDYLERPGIRTELLPSPDGNKANLLVELGPAVAADRDGLVLSGHLDVVPAEEPDWRTDPFALAETEDAYVARGACDMKGFIALATNAAARAARRRLTRPLWLILTYDEEVGTLGARDFVDRWPPARPLPRRAVIGEPTSLRVVRLHKGHAKLRIVLTGRGAHSGYPHLGKNAIEPAGRAITALAALRRRLETEPCPHGESFPEVPFVALNVAQVRGGTAINVVPERCEIDVGFRVLPGMDAGEIVARVRATLAQTLGDEPFELQTRGESPPMMLEPGNDHYRALCALVGQTETVSASFATDAGWLQTAGLDCVLWGPGSIEVAHKPNEFVPKTELRRGAELLAELVTRVCGE